MVIFLYLVFKHMKLEENKSCSLLHWDAFVFSFGIGCMLTSLTFGLSALCDCVEAEYEFRISAHVCVCASVCLCVRGTYPHEWRTKFHINQKRIMANHRIKDLSALKMASCPTNFEKLLLAHQELRFHPETACLWLRPFSTLLLSKSFLSFHPISSSPLSCSMSFILIQITNKLK